MILKPKNNPAKQAHNAGLMITDTDVNEIVKEWPKEWRVPLAEPLPKHLNKEDVDEIITSECIHLYFLCIVTQCLFRDVFVM